MDDSSGRKPGITPNGSKHVVKIIAKDRTQITVQPAFNVASE